MLQQLKVIEWDATGFKSACLLWMFDLVGSLCMSSPLLDKLK